MVIGVWHRSGRAAYPFLPTWQALTLERAGEIFRAAIRPRREIWVGTRGEQVVAFLAMAGSYIDRLYVDPAEWRRGWGTRLVLLAKTLSPDGLELHTHQENPAARRLYERLGFKAVKFGLSPPPESAPDVEYHWRPADSGQADKEPHVKRVTSPTGITVSYESYGSGPPLVLVHGGFSDQRTNWEFVRPYFEPRFTVYAIARRGRGETDATDGHSVNDEGRDVAAVIRAIGQSVFLLGHSYGAQAALAAAAEVADRVRVLVLYEPPLPRTIGPHALARLEDLARAGDWDGFAATFFRDQLFVPARDLDEVRASPLWAPIVADARASLGDLRALSRYDFRAERFRELRVPVVLQIGTESPRHLYVTDALAAVLPDVRVQELAGQAHEAMTTAPAMYAEAVARVLAATT